MSPGRSCDGDHGIWSTRLVVTALALAAAVAINTASVALEQRRSLLSRRFGRRGWYVHLAVVTPPWALFVALLPSISGRVMWPLNPRLRPLGKALAVLGAAIWLDAFARMGPERTANGYFFGHGPRQQVTGGVYRWLHNPMYDAYALVLAGVGLRTRNARFLVLAAEAYLLLNLVEARVENRPFSPAPLSEPASEDGESRKATPIAKKRR